MHPGDVGRALRVPDLSLAERVVLADLTDRANSQTNLAWPSRELLCDETGLHRKTVQHAVRRLIGLGYMSEDKSAQPGRTRTLRLHPDAWPSR